MDGYLGHCGTHAETEMTPLLSVIIPTFRRPQFLKRAIASALLAAPGGDVEVVVVPNGPDDSWKTVAESYAHDARVSWSYLETGNASAARNYGLAKARGKYVRFLDDDDFLLPAAAAQLEIINSHDSDACSAPLVSIEEDGGAGAAFNLPQSSDLVATALLSIAISGLTQGSIFKKSAIKGSVWRNDIQLYDDYLWMLSVAEAGELDWFQTTDAVGAYRQHDGARLSRIRRSSKNSRPLVEAILQLYEQLAENGRLTAQRKNAVATALLTHAHSAFPSNPVFLSQTITLARKIDPSAIPEQRIFLNLPCLSKHLQLTEWAVMMPRYITRGYRRLSWALKGWPPQT